MKTTIELSDEVLARAKRQAQREGKTLREVVERALRQQLDAGTADRPFQLKRHAFRGKGLQPGGTEGDWQSIRDLIYRLG
jgi:Arc/MetJ family transcription regulator